MKKWSLGITSLMVVGLASLTFAAALDNSAWHMKDMTKTDTLVFVNGQMTSAECIPYGFVTGPYKTMMEADKIRWTADQSNTGGEKMSWKGEAVGKTMKGTYTYTDKMGKSSTSDWTATKAEPQAK